MITNTASTITHERATPPEGPYIIPFRFDAPSWLAVTLLPPISTEGGEDDAPSPIPLEHGLDYRLSAGVVAGHTHLHALLPVPEGHRLQIQRATPAVQHLDLIPAAPLAVKDLERSLDRIAMGIQDGSPVRPIADKALAFPRVEAVTGSPVHLVSHEERKDTVLSFHPAPVVAVAPVPDPTPQTGDLRYVDFQTLSDAVQSDAGDRFDGAAAEKVEELKAGLNTALTIHREEVGERMGDLLPYDAGLKLGDTGGSPSNERSLGIQTGRMQEAHVANREESVVIGYDARSEGGTSDDSLDRQTLSIGTGAVATTHDRTYRSIAIGHLATAYGYHNVSVGPSGISGGGLPLDNQDYSLDHQSHYHTNIGLNTYTFGNGDTAVGAGSTVLGWESTAIGAGATAKGKHVLAIGGDASAMVPYEGTEFPDLSWETPALALGAGAATRHQHTAAIGAFAATLYEYSTAIGGDAEATVSHALAIGPGAKAVTGQGIAIGIEATAPAACSTVFGGMPLGPGAWACAAFGHGARLTAPRSAEITAAGDDVPGARLLLLHDHGAALSFAYTPLPPIAVPAGVAAGSEPQEITSTHHGGLRSGMLTFHSDGTSLKIHVSDTGVMRTATLGLA